MNFEKLIREMLLEDARLEHLLKTHAHKDIVKVNKETGKRKVKKAPLTSDQMMIMVGNDPTSRIDGLDLTQLHDDETLKNISPDSVKKTGEYTQWMVKQYKMLPQTTEIPYGESGYDNELSEKQRLFFEDLYKTKEDLIKFHRFKTTDKIEEADINKYSIKELEDIVAPLSLEMATSTKAERKSSMLHPGAEFMVETDKWYVVKIHRNDELGKEAAVFYGGSQKRASEGETNWCTSAPGMNYYFTYLKQGPYYVFLDKTDTKTGNVSGLPTHRYQFHFESNQFMDVNDRQIDLVKFFNDNTSLKDEFKSVITSHFSKSNKGGNKSKTVDVNYPSDGISKLIGLYGFDDFFNGLPSDLESFEFEYSNSGYGSQKDVEPPKLAVPDSISRFNQLKVLFFDNCIISIPESISKVPLNILSIPNNKGVKLPDSLADMINSGTLNILGLSGTGYTMDTLPPKIIEAINNRNKEQDENPSEDTAFLVILD